MTDSPPGKDRWDKVEILLRPIAGIATAVLVGFIGLGSKDYLQKRDAEDRRQQAYVQIMTQREDAESRLRASMFNMIVQSFLREEKKGRDVDERILNLELLCYNFHENFNVKPLFSYLRRELAHTADDEDRQEHVDRLSKLARDIVRRQVTILEQGGEAIYARVSLVDGKLLKLESQYDNPGFLDLTFVGPIQMMLQLTEKLQSTVNVDGIEQAVTLSVEQIDPATEEIQFKLAVSRHVATAVAVDDLESLGAIDEVELEESEVLPYAEATFWAGYYDFPMTDNMRLPEDQRCAVAVNKFYHKRGYVDIAVVCFPGAYASRRDKPYFEEIMDTILSGNEEEEKQDS